MLVHRQRGKLEDAVSGQVKELSQKVEESYDAIELKIRLQAEKLKQ